MALDERHIPITLLNEYFVDKDSGLPLANGTLEFYRDTSRGDAKTVYQLVNSGGVYSYTALPNPVTLNSVGTAQNAAGDNIAIYAYPYRLSPTTNKLELDLYYIVCNSSASVAQWTREAVPHLNESNDPVNDSSSGDNVLANPQFTRYFLEDSATDLDVTTTDQVFRLAPDWDLVASGTGTVTVTRTAAQGNDAIPTYPAYYLTVEVGTGITNPYLRQRLNKNSGIWSGDFLSGYVVAKMLSGSTALSMRYQDSSGVTSDVEIFPATLDTSWASYGGSVEIGDSSNTQSGSTAYVDIIVQLPLNNTTDITSIQVLVSESTIVQDVTNYDKRSANREQALMGDYYIPRLETKAIASLMTAWDFPLNPAQVAESGTLTFAAANTDYIWDQTIAQSLAANLAYARDAITGGLQLTTASNTETILLMQYLDGNHAKKFLGTPLSVNINASKTSVGDDVTVRVTLYRGAAATVLPTLPTIMGTMAADGTIGSLTSTWTEIPRGNLPTAKGTLHTITVNSDNNDAEMDLKFNGWEITDDTQIGDTDKIAVIVTCVVPTTATVITFNSISVVAGDIPTRPGKQTEEQVLQECEYYYEKSYESGIAAGTATANGAVNTLANLSSSATVTDANPAMIYHQYRTSKRTTTPAIEFYTPSGVTGKIYGALLTIVGTVTGSAEKSITLATPQWTISGASKKSFTYLPSANATLYASTGLSASAGSIQQYHYTSDDRLGK